jgi:hypothetical protein
MFKDKGQWWGAAVFLFGCLVVAIHALLSDDEDSNE